jgi:hypothetical protein
MDEGRGMDGWMDERRGMDEGRGMDGWMDDEGRGMDGWMDGWVSDGWMDGCRKCFAQVIYHVMLEM